MADETLKNTLPPLPPRTDPSATLTGDAKKDIASLEKGAGNIEAMASVMRGIGTRAYDTRQKADLELARKQFDPTKVSGGTFSSIIGNLERRRGADVSKTYVAGMTAFEKKEERKERLANEIREEQRLKEQREREDRIRQEENDRELKNQAMLMGITDLSGSSEELSVRIASAVKAKQDAQKNVSKLIWDDEGKDVTPKQLWTDEITPQTPAQETAQTSGYTSTTAPTTTGIGNQPFKPQGTSSADFFKPKGESKQTFYGPELPKHYGPQLPNQ